MAHKKTGSKKEKQVASGLSVEGSRELEPQVVPHEATPFKTSSLLSPKSLTLISLILVVVLLLASLPAYYFYNQYKIAQQVKNPTAAAEEQIKSLTAEVGKILLLPTSEAPTIATVSDKTKLTGQQFFTNAENGDKVLIFTNAKKAILYRPSLKKIIEVGPISLTGSAGKSNAQVAGASTSVTPTTTAVKVGILNGTSVGGLTKKIEQSLTSKIPAVQVIVKDNATKNDYPQTLVIASSSAQSTMAEQIAKTLGGKVSTLPTGEVAPVGAEILIILGQNNSQ
jgi:type II secretory pathway pseudopilin PulG